MRTIWIDDAAQLRDFFENDVGEVLAVDTESDHFHAYRAQVCLIQVATPEVAALIDPLALDDTALAPLFEALEDPDVVKILHAARNDIIEFDRDWNVGLSNLFDTRTAARFLGYQRNSLSWLLEELVGVKTSSKFSRFDWTTRPIPKKAKRYAVNDVIHLFELRDRFVEELRASQWMEPFTQRCVYIVEQTSHEPKAFDPEGWRGVKKSGKLDGRGRAALRELYEWRHELCLELNRAVFLVFDDAALLKLARERPETKGELRAIKGVPKKIVRQCADDILEAIERAKSKNEPSARKPRTPRERTPPGERARYDALRRWRNETAAELDIPPEFIATNAILSEVAADPPQSRAALDDFTGLLDWHRQILGGDILEVLQGAAVG